MVGGLTTSDIWWVGGTQPLILVYTSGYAIVGGGAHKTLWKIYKQLRVNKQLTDRLTGSTATISDEKRNVSRMPGGSSPKMPVSPHAYSAPPAIVHEVPLYARKQEHKL